MSEEQNKIPPKSDWIINKVYFKAEVVDNFKQVYTEWLEDYDGLPADYKGIVDLENFIHHMIKLSYKGVLELYEYPYEGHCAAMDYFEREDGNFVIPRECFIVV